MCVRDHARRLVWTPLTVAVTIVVLLPLWPALGAPAAASDPRLERATEERREAQSELDAVLQRIGALEAEADELAAELDTLEARHDAHANAADEAGALVAERMREAYIRGGQDGLLSLFAAGSLDDALEQSRLLGMLAARSQADVEQAAAARTRTAASAAEVARAADALAERRDELASARDEARELVAAAERGEQRVRDQIAAEEAERQRIAREREQREQRERAEAARAAEAAEEPDDTEEVAVAEERSDREPRAERSDPAPASGGVACPIGTPRSYSDTYGAPRSGGRSHKGVDFISPRGTPIYAYENGVISRMNSNRLGGISLYLRGDSGNVYYYTHLQGYVSGLSSGQRVGAGEQIAYNGDTGNARGIPHLHWEVMPGGGGNVNPTPYANRAC